MKIDKKNIDGVFYSVCGSGAKTIVLLRGLGRWSEHWLGFEHRLASRGYRVITIDNRGFGLSSGMKLGGCLRMDEMADDVAMILSRESPGGAHVIGVSLGGMIGLSLAAMKPQFVRSLMIVNSSVSGSKLSRLSKKGTWAILAVVLGAKKSYESLAKALLGKDTASEKKFELASKWQATDAAAKPKLANICLQLMAAKNFSGLTEMAAIRCPVTVVKCEGDLFVDPKNSDFIQKHIKNAELMIHPTAGHEVAFDDPEWFAQVIAKQLEACP